MSVEIQDRDQHGMGSLQCAIGSTLFLAVKQISSLPETIGQLTALHILDLEENELSSLRYIILQQPQRHHHHQPQQQPQPS